MLRKFPFLTFFILAYSLTWFGSVIYVLALPKNGSILPPFLNYVGVLIWYFGPCLAAIFVTRTTAGKDSLRNLLKRLLDWRVPIKWYVFIVLYPFVLHLSVVYLHHLLGGPSPVFFRAEGVPSGNKGLVILMLVLYHTFVRGIGEEVGWRGFAVSRLQSHWNALVASLILGLVWAGWHIHPANFGALRSSNGIFIVINIILITPVFSWVYNHTRGSIFIAALFHMTLNVVEYMVPISFTQAGLARSLLQVGLILVTLTVLIIVSGMQLGKRPQIAPDL